MPVYYWYLRYDYDMIIPITAEEAMSKLNLETFKYIEMTEGEKYILLTK